jgi:putative phosphotransacetylase
MDLEALVREIATKVINENAAWGEGSKIPIGVSARHVHLCRFSMDTLFGEKSELTLTRELMGGQFAAAETLSIVSRQQKILTGVRVLGPLRAFTQAEVSQTDSRALGCEVPLRDSGDIKGSTSFSLIGPRGVIHLKEGMIVAKRHIHMSETDAAKFSLKDKEILSVKIPGSRGGIMANILVRVDKAYTLEMHIDTDEANAFGVKNGDFVQIRGLHDNW